MDITLDTSHRQVFRTCGVRVAYLFGSAASGATHAGSDVDVAVLAHHRLRRDERRMLQTALAEACQKPVGAVDLADLRTANPLLGFLAVTEGVKIFGSADADDDAFRRAVSAHLDAQPLYDLDHAYAHAAA